MAVASLAIQARAVGADSKPDVAKSAAKSTPATMTMAPETAEAVFAGGCFWCVESAFQVLPGVKSVVSGFSGGDTPKPTYEQVSAGKTTHAESVQILYDPAQISYAQLLDVFWHNIDPTQANGQFCDHGNQYRSAIFYRDETQHRLALESKQKIEVHKQLDKPIVTQIVAFKAFWPAEDYHQDYFLKNPAHYQSYRLGCGRDARLKELWGEAASAHR